MEQIVVVDLFFLKGPYVKKYSRHWTTHKTVMIHSILWIVFDKKSQEDDDNNDSLNELPFSSQFTQTEFRGCELAGWL